MSVKLEHYIRHPTSIGITAFQNHGSIPQFVGQATSETFERCPKDVLGRMAEARRHRELRRVKGQSGGELRITDVRGLKSHAADRRQIQILGRFFAVVGGRNIRNGNQSDLSRHAARGIPIVTSHLNDMDGAGTKPIKRLISHGQTGLARKQWLDEPGDNQAKTFHGFQEMPSTVVRPEVPNGQFNLLSAHPHKLPMLAVRFPERSCFP